MGKLFVALTAVAVVASALQCSGIVNDDEHQRAYEFDLSILHHNDSVHPDPLWYRSDDGKIYYVNFCGQTSSGCDADDTSVCINISDKYVSGGSTSTQTLSLAEAPNQTPETSVTVTYSHGDVCGNGHYKTKIYVNCNKTADPGFFYKIEQPNECETILYMWSAAGCGKEVPYTPSSSSSSSHEPGTCGAVIIDKEAHHQYEFDLTMLHQDNKTHDPLWYRSKDGTIYYVNFCGPTVSCDDKDVSVCICIPDGNGDNCTHVNGGRTSTQVFSIAEDPNQTAQTSVTATYSNGDKCENGYYKTKIYVNCKEDAVPGYFYNIEQTNKCEATLYMWSAAGCGKEIPYPSSSSSSSSHEPGTCGAVITDKEAHHQYEFDLTMLHQDNKTHDPLWYRSKDGSIYYVNFCGPTVSCDDKDVSVCICIPDGNGDNCTHVNGGRTSTQVFSIAEDPNQTAKTSVTATYSNGDKCENGYYKTKIYINCKEDAVPGYFYNIEKTNKCEATLYMWSAAGCGREVPYQSSSSSSSTPVTSSSSSAPVSSSSSSTEPGSCGAIIADKEAHRLYEFDLSKLHQKDSSPRDKLWYRSKNGTIYYVNFCGPTIACNDNDTSVCICIPNGNDDNCSHVNGGRTSTQTFSIAEAPNQTAQTSLTVTYSNGDKCGDGNYKTKIYINCQETATPGYFYYVEQPNECEATLYMWSAAGCGREIGSSESSSPLGSRPFLSMMIIALLFMAYVM